METKTKVKFHSPYRNETGEFGTPLIPEGVHTLACSFDGKNMHLDEAVRILTEEAGKHQGNIEVPNNGRNYIIYSKKHTSYLLIQYSPSPD